jgi:hypothetical protein
MSCIITNLVRASKQDTTEMKKKEATAERIVSEATKLTCALDGSEESPDDSEAPQLADSLFSCFSRAK